MTEPIMNDIRLLFVHATQNCVASCSYSP